MRFDYTSPCPECSKMGASSTLGFDSDTSKITCNGETVHEFDAMPTETAPAAESEKLGATSEFEKIDASKPEVWTPEEEAALDAAMAQAPRRDFGSMVTDPEPEIGGLGAQEQQGEAIGAPIFTASDNPSLGLLGLPRAGVLSQPETGHAQPLVGLGGFAELPGGDILCGVRIPETWVSAVAAEGENQTPQKNVAEYLQEILDLGLIEWHLPAQVTR